MDHKADTVDTVIIGAGFAGIGAARVFENFNKPPHNPKKYIVLEATDKIGGRVKNHTIELNKGGVDSQGITLDAGMHWIHTDPSEKTKNPMLADLARQNSGVRLEHDAMSRDSYVHGVRESQARMELRINQAFEIINKYQGEDKSILDVLQPEGFTKEELESTFGEAETGKPVHQTSVYEIKNLVPRLMGEIAPNGMYGIVDALASEDVKKHIKYKSPVTKIKWDGGANSGVTVTTETGDCYRAKNVILTASIGALQSKKVSFIPPLPPSHQEAIDHIKMVDFNKVFLVFDDRFRFPDVPGSRFKFPLNHYSHMDVTTSFDQGIFYQIEGTGKRVVTAYLGGELGKLCENEPEKAKEIALNGLAEIWGNEIKSHIIHVDITQWGQEPYIRGSYSIPDIGHTKARETLEQPIKDKLFFAGEALATIDPVTGKSWATHGSGAYESGKRAAAKILEKALKKERTPLDIVNKQRPKIYGFSR